MKRAAMFSGGDLGVGGSGLSHRAFFGETRHAVQRRVVSSKPAQIHARQIDGGDLTRAHQLRQLPHRQKGDVFDPGRPRDTGRRRKAHPAALWQVERDARRTGVEMERQRRRVRERRFVDAIDVRRQARQRRREILAFGVGPVETGQPRGFANHRDRNRAASGFDLRPQRAREQCRGEPRRREIGDKCATIEIGQRSRTSCARGVRQPCSRRDRASGGCILPHSQRANVTKCRCFRTIRG